MKNTFSRRFSVRILSLLVAVGMLLSIYAPVVYADGEETMEEYSVCIFSSVVGGTFVPVYVDAEGSVYMDVHDVCRLTRSRVENAGSDKVTLIHGARSVVLDMDNGKLIESEMHLKHSIGLSDYGGMTLVEAEPILLYMGATLTVKKSDEVETPVLLVTMPDVTIWEALMDPPANLDIYSIYGGKAGVYISLTCDIIMDMIYGHGIFVESADYYEDMYYEVLNYSFQDNDLMMDRMSKSNEQRNAIYMTEVGEGFDVLANVYEMERDSIKSTEAVWNQLKDLAANERMSAEFNVSHATEANIDFYTEQLQKSVHNEEMVKDMYDEVIPESSAQVNNVVVTLKMFNFFLNVFQTYESLYSVNYERVNMLNDVIGDENLRQYGIKSRTDEFYTVGMDLIEKLKKTDSQKLTLSIITEVKNNLVNDIKEKGAEAVIKLFTSNVNSVKVAFSFAKFFTYVFFHDTIEAYAADLKGLYLSKLQDAVGNIVVKTYYKTQSQKGADGNTLVDLQTEGKMYCLTSLSMYKNLRQSLLEFCPKKQHDSINRWCDDLEREATDSYYRYCTCKPAPIPDISEMSFEAFSELLGEDAVKPKPVKRVENPKSIITDQKYRDIVLVLDVSGSMSGTPYSSTYAAAEKFVDQLAGGNTRVGIVTYESNSRVISPLTSDPSLLKERMEDIRIGDMTNMYSGMSEAGNLLSKSGADKKIIVLMSDGLPNESDLGRYSNYEDYGDEVASLAQGYKDQGYYIYTLGFFQDIRSSGSDLSTAQNILIKIAGGDGYYYDIEDAESIELFFDDIATDISGQHSIMIRIACPVDVYVTYNGETLSSASESRNNRTSFGSISYTGDDDEVKNVRLLEGANYDIVIKGYDEGTMDYTISYPDEDGEYTDVRTFNDIPVTAASVVTTETKKRSKTVVKLDVNGDGRTDVRYKAGKNGTGEIAGDYTGINIFVFLLVAAAVTCLLLGKDRLRKIFAVRNPAAVPVGGYPEQFAANDPEQGMGNSPGQNVPAAGFQPVQQPETAVYGYCRNCGAQLIGGTVCGSCGFENNRKSAVPEPVKAEPVRFCTNCGGRIPAGKTECPDCGFPVPQRDERQ